ncbi:hypothetical protein ABZ589_17020 [Streptomyces sp. NPDC013313]|uniref:hypothetical protein n=1 Tax=Streptomyces sp. NPDC013313 TaxID=3155603 RepID=UPI0033D40874
MSDKHAADRDRVSHQNNFTDLARDAAEHPNEGGFLKRAINGVIRGAAQATPFSTAMVSRTEFDESPLNHMLDLVERTDPEDLESSGKALWDARDAIKSAADELKGQFETVPWVGKAGDDFRTWGSGLVSSTYDLSAFAGGAGDQISAAAMGLASVRAAMPARDPANHKQPKHFTATEKAANKEEYAAAVKVEKDRQEAINQMNRLASYYAVSSEQLQQLQASAPEFKGVPDVGVPKPQRYTSGPDAGSSASGAPAGGTPSPAGGGHHLTAPVDGVRPVTGADTPAPVQHAPGHQHLPVPDQPVGTNIDSTGTLPPPTTTGPAQTPPVIGTSPTGGGQPPVFDGPFGTPMPNAGSGRSLNGTGGFRTPPSAPGRTGAPGLAGPGSGRSAGQGPVNQMGRATPTGQSPVKGAASGPKSSPVGRAVTGGTPRPGGTAAPRANGGPATGAGRSNGVVGGRPTNTGGAPVKGGSRIPRGTVIGQEAGGSSRPGAGRLGQRGVVGASESEARPGTGTTGSRARAGSAESVTGRPAARGSAAGAERNGMTRGGAGLVRGAGRSGKPGEGDDTQGAARPDYLVEDEETHLPSKHRRDVPPVVD